MVDKICTCKNMSVIVDMIDLFENIGENVYRKDKYKTTSEQREKAILITNKIISLLSDNVIHPYSFSKREVNFKLNTARKYLREYMETNGAEPIFALEEIRGLIHQDRGIRAKLLCQNDSFTVENKLLYDTMQALRGVGNYSDAKRIIRFLNNNITCTKL